MAERLRRLTRNQIPSGSVGSNPTDREIFLISDNYFDEIRRLPHLGTLFSKFRDLSEDF